MIAVRPLGRESDDVYAAFLDRASAASPEVLAYHSPLYRDMLVEAGVGTPAYLGAFDGAALVGALPGFLRESAHGSCYCSLPYFGPNAGVIAGGDDARAPEIHRELIGAAVAMVKSCRHPLTAAFYTPFLSERWDCYRASLEDAIEVDKETQYLDLARLSAFDPKVAYDIRKAEKAGVTVSSEISGGAVQGFYDIYADNCREFGIPLKPFAAIRTLVARGRDTGLARLYLAHHEGALVGGLLMLWSRQTASYYVPCTKTSARGLQPGSLLIDRAIRDAQAHGLRYWNWESSPPDRPGVFDFKKKWGSQLSRYKIFVARFCAESDLARIGAAELARSFPYFFVYPHARLAA